MAEIIVVHGTPGAGTSAHCEKLAEAGLEDRIVRHITLGDDAPAETANTTSLEPIPELPSNNLILVSSYPRYAHSVEPFHTSLHEKRHRLLGTIALELAQPASIARIMARGWEEGQEVEILKGFTEEELLESYAIYEYAKYNHAAVPTILALARIAPLEQVDGGGSEDAVHREFRRAVTKLISTS